MNLSKQLGILIASVLLALLLLAPSEVRNTQAGSDAPPNDDFADAIVIGELPFSDAINTTGATAESAEVTSSCVPGGSSEPAIESTVWYRYEAMDEVVLIANTEGSDFDTILNLFIETDAGLILVTCQENAPQVFAAQTAFRPLPQPQKVIRFQTTPRVAFRTLPGRTYLFQVGGSSAFGPSTGNLAFNFRAAVAPANDDFADAEEMGVLPTRSEQEVTAGTLEVEEPVSTCMRNWTPTASVWYRLQVERDSFYRFDADNPVGFGRFVIAIFRGEELESLEEVHCGSPNNSDTRLGFEAEAGEELYIQIVSYTPGRLIFGPEGTRVLDERGLTLEVQRVELPPCPPPDLLFEDKRDDVVTVFFVRVPGEDDDILSVGRSVVGDQVCFQIEFKEPVEPPTGVYVSGSIMKLEIDLDGKTLTGLTSRLCGGGEQLGYEAYLSLEWESGQLLDIYSAEISSDERNTLSAVALFAGRFVTFVAPAVMFGDDAYHFVLQVNDQDDGDRDCAPNRGFYSTAQQLGDASCDSVVDSIDAALVLQFDARLIPELGCREVSDVDGNGTISSIDAALILQFSAGLINVLPGEAREAIAAVVQLTAESRGIPKKQIEVSRVTAETWSNACLGLPKAGEVCAAVLTPGYRISVWLGPEGITYRTDLTGSIIRVEGGFIV